MNNDRALLLFIIILIIAGIVVSIDYSSAHTTIFSQMFGVGV